MGIALGYRRRNWGLESMTEKTDEQSKSVGSEQTLPAKTERQEIKGGLPYSSVPSAFKKALDGIIAAERPEKFSSDFMSTILKVSGGSARQIPPMLKKMGFLTSEASPTDLYSKFKSDSARGQSALDGLKNAYGELFRRNDFIHRADDNTVKDLIVEITGLKKNDRVISMIFQSFEAIRGFADKSSSPSAERDFIPAAVDDFQDISQDRFSQGVSAGKLGLSYNINVVLPETENIAVFNAIFRSLRENLL